MYADKPFALTALAGVPEDEVTDVTAPKTPITSACPAPTPVNVQDTEVLP
jgi:hypothetical protein